MRLVLIRLTMNADRRILLISCTVLHFFLSDALRVCDLQKANTCFDNVTAAACLPLIDNNFIVTKLEICTSSYVDSCNSFVKTQWLDAVSNLIGTLNEDCTPECNDATLQLSNCKENMYTGLKSLALSIVTNDIPPSNIKCSVGLKSIYDCITDAVAKCQSLEYYASETLQAESSAFEQCDINITRLMASVTGEENNASTTDVIPEDTSLKTALLAGLVASGFVVLIAGGIILYMWMDGIRQSNFKLATDTPGRPNSLLSFSEDTSRSWRSRRYLRRDSEERTTDSLRSHYKPWSRWWTRPGFGTYGVDIQPDYRL